MLLAMTPLPRLAMSVSAVLSLTCGVFIMLANPAHALDTEQKPGKADFHAAARALDLVEDAVILGRPLPPHDPALGSHRVRLDITTPGYRYEPWNGFYEEAVGTVNIRIAARGVAPGPLTVWVRAGGHACVPNTSSKWQRVTIANGGTFVFPLKNKSYSTGIFMRVSDQQHHFRYAVISVSVSPKYDDGRTPAIIVWN